MALLASFALMLLAITPAATGTPTTGTPTPWVEPPGVHVWLAGGGETVVGWLGV